MPSQPRIESHPPETDEDSPSAPELVCGVEKSLVERFLTLLRENYKKTDKATFFLEQRTGIINLQGVMNVRDVLSHLVTFLDPKLSRPQREEQIHNAEEHLRRSAVEPYEIAVNELLTRFASLYEKYKEHVNPARDEHVALSSAPTLAVVETKLREIQEISGAARSIKGQNIWDSGWERGIAGYIEAFDKLSELYSEIESYWYKYEQIERDFAKAKQLNALELKIEEASRELLLQHQKARRLALLFAGISVILLLLLTAVWIKR